MTENEKLNNFHAAIEEYAINQKKLIEEEIVKNNEKELAEAKDEALQTAYNMIQKEMAQMRKEISSEFSKKEADKKRALIEKRLEITNKVFEKAQAELCRFAESPEYEEFMTQRAKAAAEIINAPDTAVFLREKDSPLFQKLSVFFKNGCHLETDDSIKTGGFIIESRSLGLRVDSTLSSRLSEQKEWFRENSGLIIE